MEFASRRLLSSFVSLLLLFTVTSVGLSQNSFASEKYKDLEIGPFSFTDISLCSYLDPYIYTSDRDAKEECVTYRPQLPATIWAFSIRNNGKAAYSNVRVEIQLQNETGADLYNNILVVTSKIEPQETVWVAPEVQLDGSSKQAGGSFNQGGIALDMTAQGTFQGVTKGVAKIISAKKVQVGKYRIKGFASGEFTSISDQKARMVGVVLTYASASKGRFKAPAYRVIVNLPTAVDAKRVPKQWVSVLLKDATGKNLGGFKFKNEGGVPPFSALIVQDKEMLKSFVSAEVYIARI
jgi:hypothetical protein